MSGCLVRTIAIAALVATMPTESAGQARATHDKAFWQSVAANKYAPPAGEPIEPLVRELSSLLGSPDPELRDDIAYSTLVSWIYRQKLVSVEQRESELVVSRKDDTRQARSLHGLTRKLLANGVTGVTTGFTRVLEINGVGYRADLRGKMLHLTLGYSHPILFQLPEGITAKVDRQVVITLEGSDRQLLGETAALIRKLRPPEPYKGKGIKYAEETIRRKSGKAAGAA